MSSLRVRDARGETLYSEAAFPLAFGQGEGESIPVPGWGLAEAAAFLSADGRALYVAPGPRAFPLLVNGRRIAEQTRLNVGDRIRIGQSEWTLESPDPWLLVWRPVMSQAREADGDIEAAAPVSFEALAPSASAGGDGKRPPRRTALWTVLLFSLALIGIAAWFLFQARPLSAVFTPAAERVSVTTEKGFVLKVGDAWLALPGEYTLHASKSGYHDFSERVNVDSTTRDPFRFAFTKLPGRLTIHAHRRGHPDVLVTGGAVRAGEHNLGALSVMQAELAAGPHDLVIEVPRFLPLTNAVDIVGMSTTQEVVVALIPGWADVVAQTQPETEVRSGGAVIGRSGEVLELMAGTHVLTFFSATWIPWTTQIVVAADTRVELPTVHLVREPGRVQIVSEPEGAAVTVAGEFRGRAPVHVELPPLIEHPVVLTLPGHEDHATTVTVEPEEKRTLRISMKPLTGRVRVLLSPADAEIYVNDARVPTAPVLELIATPQRIEARREGHISKVVTITPRPGIEQEVDLRLQPVPPPTAPKEVAPAPPPRLTAPDGTRLIRFDGARFTAGSPRGEQGRRSNENQRAIRLERPFLFAATETSNEQFRTFNPGHDSGSHRGQSLNGPAQPVVSVTWAQAAAYCNWLSDKEKLPHAYREENGTWVAVTPVPTGYRMITEAEWEFAARVAGGTTARRFSWGDDLPPPDSSENLADTSARSILTTTIPSYRDGHAVTSPVGVLPAGPSGAHDLGGNVAEWCHDGYDVVPAMETREFVDPIGNPRASLRSIRGASWMHSGVARLRAAYRDYGEEPRPDVGFRIARYLNPPATPGASP